VIPATHIKPLLLAAAFFLSLGLAAQKNKAVLSRSSISMSETTQLTLTAEGDQIISAFSGPVSPGVMVLSDFSSSNTVNGKVQLVQRFELQPLQPGTWTLGPFVARGRNGPVRIQPVTLTITGQPVSSGFSGKEIFLQSDLPGKTFYEGQEIAVNVRVYVQESYGWQPGMLPLSSPSFVGFWHERGPDGVQYGDTTIVKNGKRYTGHTLLREFLFASRTGSLSIPAFNYECQLTSPSGNGFYTETPVNLLSDPRQLQIIPFPAGAPAGFANIAGSFSLRASLDKPRVKAFDVVTLTITISGQGNLRTLQMPAPVLPDSIDVLPGQSDDSTTVTAFGVLGYKVFTWTLIPKQAGKFLLDSISFVYFSPEKKQYITLSTPPFELLADPPDPAIASQVNTAPANQLTTGEKQLTWLYVLLIVLPVALLGLLWWWRMRKRQKPEAEIQPETPAPQPISAAAAHTPVFSQLFQHYRQLPPEEFIKLLYTSWHNELCRYAGISPTGASLQTIRYGLLNKNHPEALCEEALRPLDELALLRFASPTDTHCRYWLDECHRLKQLLDT
jgi:hypothetical protein